MFHFWREVGRRMNIRDLPEDYDAFERFNRDYERQHVRYTESNRRVGKPLIEMFAGWGPRPAAPLVRSALYAMLEDTVINAFGFPQPSRPMRWLVPATLRLRGRLLRWLPPRRRPRLRTEMKRPTYPAGYTIELLGPPE